MGYQSLLQGIFLTQVSNSWLLHWQAGSLPVSHQGSPKIWTVVRLNMVFIYFFSLHALTKFFSQYPQTTFSIIKVASPSLWPKGDRLTGSIIALLVQLLVTLALSTCWGSRSPPITALERCPCWLHRADRAYDWLICLESQVQPHPSWFHLDPSWRHPPSLHFLSLYIYIYTCVCVCVCVYFRVK